MLKKYAFSQEAIEDGNIERAISQARVANKYAKVVIIVGILAKILFVAFICYKFPHVCNSKVCNSYKEVSQVS